jgi:hypothetical protein
MVLRMLPQIASPARAPSQSLPNTADKLRGARARGDAHDDNRTAVTTDYHASLLLRRRLVSFIRLLGDAVFPRHTPLSYGMMNTTSRWSLGLPGHVTST